MGAMSRHPIRGATDRRRASDSLTDLHLPRDPADAARSDLQVKNAAASHDPRNRASARGAATVRVIERARAIEQAAPPAVEVPDLAVRQTGIGELASLATDIGPQRLVVRERARR